MKDTEDPYEEEYYYYEDDEEALDDLEEDIEQTRADMNETLHALENRLLPSQLVDQALNYFRGANDSSTEFTARLSQSIKSNPVPATLLGISLAWLMLGKPEQSESPDRRTYPVAPATPESEESRDEQAAHAARDNKTGQAAYGTRQKKDEAAESRHRRAPRWSDRAQARTGQARRNLTSMLQERPLVFGGIGIAVGAALGVALPPTRREDRAMGQKRDEWLAQAEAMGKEQWHRTEQVAQAAEEAAHEESQRQGLVSEAAEAPLQESQQNASPAAGAVRETAEPEVKPSDRGGS